MRYFGSTPALFGLALLGSFSLLLTGPSEAAAQTGVPTQRFSVNLFNPAPGPGNYLAVDGAQVGGHLTASAGLVIDYAQQPFVLYRATCTDDTMANCETNGVESELVRYSLTGHVLASLALFDRLQIGLDVPVALTDGEGFSSVVGTTPVSLNGGSAVGIGDIRLSLKARILGQGDGLFFGAAAWVTAPIGQAMNGDSFMGDHGVTAGGHFIGQFVQSRFHVAGNIGAFYRDERTLFSTQVGSKLTYRLAAGYDVTPLVMVFGELDGASSFSSQIDENPLEARVAGRIRQGDFTFTLGGGAGLLSGVGVPIFRVIGGFAWAPIRLDQDGDGILDQDDACPSEAEDMDGWEDTDGCPEADNDQDGLLDADDPCPDQAEDVDGFEDDDGCPDLDNDGDGVTDAYDSCPNDAEDMDGDRDEDGCPDNDTDRDGIPDDVDQCPNDPEDTDGFGDEDGCPETDFDQDGIPDEDDECPDQPELINGIDDQDGCPEADADGDGIPDASDRCPNRPETINGVSDTDGCPDGEAVLRIEGEQIVLLQQIQFRTNRARIRHGRSPRILQAIATILRQHPEYAHVRIEGHTDNQGNEARNIRLSQQRADAVKAALVRLGVDAGRLEAQGIGPARPVADNDTDEGRTQNRRIEFHIEPAAPTPPTAPTPEAPPAATDAASE
ncbi:MAG: OmpA family protein [Deltaproteobacteria bacterium]|nr:OmpA family protein [Deltaproteobacteria bacterium]